MIGVPGMTSSRRVGKLEKPRPLKLTTINDHSNSEYSNELESVLMEMDTVSQQLNSSTSTTDQNTYNSIISLCENLKTFGPQLENVYKDQLDRCYVSIRNGCRDDKLNLQGRYRLLEVLELRAMQWHPNENHVAYFKQKLAQFETEENQSMEDQSSRHPSPLEISNSPYVQPGSGGSLITTHTGPAVLASPIYPTPYVAYPQPQPQPQIVYAPAPQPSPQGVTTSPAPGTPPSLAPGEVVKSSGKYSKPARIPGKNYCKDEIVIRNADSGKVMGLKGRRVHMIEELSETIISFQRVAPGARERLVQITGPTEDNISQARQLIEETIRRNASPVRTEESIYSNVGGSSSSISSHTSDETLQGNKRNNNGRLEEPLGEYRYTVVHDNDVIRITGTNLDLVRTAKLILDEYFSSNLNFNNLNLLSPDIEPMSLSTPPSFSSPPESREKTPPKSVTPPGGQNIPTMTQDNGSKGSTVAILRQPLLPSSSKEAVESVEKETQSQGKKNISNRRALFAKTSEERNSHINDSNESCSGSSNSFSTGRPSQKSHSRISYSREFLLKCAESPLSLVTPTNWAQICQLHPSFTKKEGDATTLKELLKDIPKERTWSIFRSSSTSEMDDNGN